MALAAGEPRTLRLTQAASVFMFVPVVERAIEQPHAVVHTKLARRKVKPPFVSLAARLPVLERSGLISEGTHNELCAAYAQTSVPRTLAKLMWLDEHPQWQAIASCNLSKQLKVLSELLYRCDLDAMFQSQKRARAIHNNARQSEMQNVAQVLKQHRRRKSFTSFEALMSALVLEHLRAVAVPGQSHPPQGKIRNIVPKTTSSSEILSLFSLA